MLKAVASVFFAKYFYYWRKRGFYNIKNVKKRIKQNKNDGIINSQYNRKDLFCDDGEKSAK